MFTNVCVQVNVMFHCAATVKFDEQLRAALATNVRAPLHLLRLARDMRQLQVSASPALASPTLPWPAHASASHIPHHNSPLLSYTRTSQPVLKLATKFHL